MNGIKFIRTRCNLSIGDLSEILGVTRQALGSWENGTKQLPKQRAKELSEFFGLHEKYFGELSDADMEELCTMPMYRDDVNGKETYKYKEPSNYKWQARYFFNKSELSFSEKLALAKKRKQDTLKRIDDLIEETETSHLFDKSHLLNRNCCAYDVINDLISFSRTMDGKLRVGFASDVLGIWKAMLIAYGLRDESIIIRSDTPELPLEDEEWILKLSEMFKEHWDEKHSVYVDFYKKRGLRIRNPEQNPKIVAK